MVRRWVRHLLSGLLVACSLPLRAISFVIAALFAATAAFVRLFQGGNSGSGFESPASWAAGEFRFERAIESYETLIDAHVWRLK